MVTVFALNRIGLALTFSLMGVALLPAMGLAQTPQPSQSQRQTQENPAIAPLSPTMQYSQVASFATQPTNIFTPPPRPTQQNTSQSPYRSIVYPKPAQERGDRPQLRDLMRLEPAILPHFVYYD